MTAGEGPPHPREALRLVGHESAERTLLAALAAGRMPHAWLIAGPRGVGKATLAYRLAAHLLSGGTGRNERLEADPANPAVRRLASGGHADVIVLEREIDEQRKRLRSEITVDQVRRLGRAFTMTSAENGWRIGIVDSACELNRNAANALLKLLEEPPRRSLLLLTAHQPGRILPTIASRCRRLVLRPLPEQEVAAVLSGEASDIPEEERLAIGRLAEGCPGRALELAAGGGLAAYRDLVGLLKGLPRLDYARAHELSDRLNRPGAEEAFRLWLDLLRLWLTRAVRGSVPDGDAGGAPDAVAGEAAAARRLMSSASLDRWVALWEKIGHLAARADGVNLERKQVVLSALFAVENCARGRMP